MATTVSTEGDSDTLPQIHQGLANKNLLPSQHIVDTDYMSADMLVQSQDIFQVDLVGPARKDQKWQFMGARAMRLPIFKWIGTIDKSPVPKGIRLNPGLTR